MVVGQNHLFGTLTKVHPAGYLHTKKTEPMTVIRARQGNRPDRRWVQAGTYSKVQLEALVCKTSYVGSSIHKLKPGDYGFVPPTNPRPSKSPCDDRRIVLKDEAKGLLAAGIRAGMLSTFAGDGVPKYVWAVDGDGEVYEAKTNPGLETAYHGYRLGDDEAQLKKLILQEWKLRCR